MSFILIKLLLLVQYLVMGVSLNLKLFVTASPDISLSLNDANSQFTIFIRTTGKPVLSGHSKEETKYVFKTD